MEKEVSCEDIYNAIGELTDEKCPDCNSPLVADKTGTKWCSSEFCDWSNDEGMREFKRSLIE